MEPLMVFSLDWTNLLKGPKIKRITCNIPDSIILLHDIGHLF